MSQMFILLSHLEPLYNDELKPIIDSQKGSSEEYDKLLTITSDILGSLYVGIPGMEWPFD